MQALGSKSWQEYIGDQGRQQHPGPAEHIKISNSLLDSKVPMSTSTCAIDETPFMLFKISLLGTTKVARMIAVNRIMVLGIQILKVNLITVIAVYAKTGAMTSTVARLEILSAVIIDIGI
jgi:hypothetical protein